MMRVAGLRQVQQVLQQPLYVGGFEEVVASRDECDALMGIVDHDGEMIGGWNVFPRQNNVADRSNCDLARFAVRALTLLLKRQRAGDFAGLGDTQAQRVRRVRGQTVCAFALAQIPAGARIDRAIGAVRSLGGAGDLIGDLLACAKAGIDQTIRLKLLKRGLVGGDAIGLTHHRLLPGNPEPRQILENGGDEFLAATRRIDILDSNDQALAQFVRSDRREGVAEMQEAGWTWRKSRDNHKNSLQQSLEMLIRRARVEDGHAVAAVRVASWRAAYRALVPQSYLESMPANVEHWCAIAAGSQAGTELLVCEEEGDVVGFACFGAARPPHFEYSGELYAAYFLPQAMGKGFGTAMLRQAMERLVDMGHNDMMLWVMEDNARGRRFYERAGGVVIANSRQSFVIDERTIWEVAYGFRPLSAALATG